MERKLIIALLLFSLLLAGCNATTGLQSSLNSESFESSDSFDEEIPKKYQPYSIYWFDMKFNFVAPPIVVNTPKIYMSNEVVEEGVASQTLDLLFTQVDSQYYNSQSTIGIRAALSRYFVTQYGSVMLDSATGKVVELNFKVSDKIDTNKEAKKITQEECDTILLEYLNHLGFDPNQGNYKLQKSSLHTINEGTSYARNIYGYKFKKYIDGVETSDMCSVGITEYGSLLYYKRGDAMDDAEIEALSIDYKRTEALAKEYAENVCDGIDSGNCSYSLSSPYLLLLDDGSYAVWYAIDIQLGKNGEETGLSIIIPVS